jgi:hypothetical protein
MNSNLPTQLTRDDYFYEVTEMVNILPCKLVVYNKFEAFLKEGRHYIPKSYLRNVTELDQGRKKNKSEGEISRKAAIRIRKAVRLQILTAKKKRVYSKKENKWFTFYINFATLTLSSKQIHSDDEIKKFVLRPFLRVIKNKFGVSKYIWKAESQVNNNIHFHLTLDKFIHWRQLRKYWNKCQNALGYVHRSGISDPNSTDIHSVKNISKLENYLIKYLTKNDDSRRKIEGKTWDCSSNLKTASLSVPYSQFYKEFNVLTKDEVIDLREKYFHCIDISPGEFKKHQSLVNLWNNFSSKLVDDIQTNFVVETFY